MRKQSVASISAAIALALAAGSAQAASPKTDTMPITATVAANCFINSVGTMAFGNYVGGEGDKTSSADIALRCSKGAAYTIALGQGNGLSYSPRKLSDGGVGSLEYNLFVDAGASTTVWGDGTGITQSVGGSGNGLGNPFTKTVYGRLFDNASNQNAPVGSYNDTVLVSVSF